MTALTEKLYYKDQYLKTFEAVVISCEKRDDGKFDVVLNKTAFFPEGGGQDADSGTIDGKEVEYVYELGDEVVHILNEEIAISKQVECQIDFKKRFRLMQIHSGEHIFCGIAHSLFDVENMGFHVGHDGVVVDLNKVLTNEEINRVETLANEVIWENRIISSCFLSDDEAKNVDFRSKKEIKGEIRIVAIDNCDNCACCGIHVKNTGEIGVLKVISVAKKRNGSSITMLIGQDALFDYQKKHNQLSKVGAMLSLKPFEIVDGVEKLKLELSNLEYELNQLKLSVFKNKIEALSGEIAIIFENDFNTEDIRVMCDLLADKVTVAAVLSGNDAQGYKYSICSRVKDLRALAKEFNSACNGRGGGRPEMIQGSVNATQKTIESFLNNLTI